MPPLFRSNHHTAEVDNLEDRDLPSAGLQQSAAQHGMRLLVFEFIGRWHWITLGMILGVWAAAYFLSKAPKQYRAVATLLINEQTDSLIARDQVDKINLRSQEAMATVAAQIRRTDLLDRVATRGNVRSLPGLVPPKVYWLPPWLGNKLDKTQKQNGTPCVTGNLINSWLQTSVRRGTRLLDISVTHPVPAVSAALANAIVAEYLLDISNDKNKEQNNAISLLQEESKGARADLRKTSGILAIYARAMEIHKTLEAKELEASNLRRRYLPKHPRMVTANVELQQLRQDFIREFGLTRQHTSDQSYWEVAGNKLPDVLIDPDGYVRIARQQLVSHIGVLENEIRCSTSVFNSMLTRIQETSVNRASGASSTEVSELATLPEYPSSPSPGNAYVLGGLGGLAGGGLLAFLLIRIDNKYRTVAQISAETGCAILGAIPMLRISDLAKIEIKFIKQSGKPVHNGSSWDRRLLFRGGLADTSYAERYRSLRVSVSLLGDESKRKITLITSALPGEGKSLTAANFAASAAEQGRKTLLIDLDLRKPTLHKLFGVSQNQRHGGIAECLANLAPFEDVICHDSGHPYLDLIVGGKRASNPGELLNTGRLRDMLALACREYEVVVLDTAPILPVTDTRIIACLVHNVCMVAKSSKTPKQALRLALDVLETDGVALSGIIFNGYAERRYLMGQNYSYGYYKSSRYGYANAYNYAAYGADNQSNS